MAIEKLSRRQALKITAVAGVGLALGAPVVTDLIRRARLHQVSVTRTQLGTAVTVTVVHPDAAQAHSMVTGAFVEIERLEGVLSRYRPETPLARLNRDGVVTEAPVELVEVVSRALEYARLTDGAFDITVAPVLNMYVSRAAAGQAPPTEAEVAVAMPLVGWRGVELNGNVISLARPGMALTLDAIAKGFVVDRAVATLRDSGADRVLVEAGGDMATGADADDPWQVAIRDPHDERNTLGVVQLRGTSLASSGDYQQYFSPDRLLNHIIDPRTGRSPLHASGATVQARSATDADALSTSVFVLGPQAGMALLDKLDGIEGMLVTKTGEIFQSKGFQADQV